VLIDVIVDECINLLQLRSHLREIGLDLGVSVSTHREGRGARGPSGAPISGNRIAPVG